MYKRYAIRETLKHPFILHPDFRNHGLIPNLEKIQVLLTLISLGFQPGKNKNGFPTCKAEKTQFQTIKGSKDMATSLQT